MQPVKLSFAHRKVDVGGVFFKYEYAHMHTITNTHLHKDMNTHKPTNMNTHKHTNTNIMKRWMGGLFLKHESKYIQQKQG